MVVQTFFKSIHSSLCYISALAFKLLQHDLRVIKINICEEHFRWWISALWCLAQSLPLSLSLSLGWLESTWGDFPEITVTMTTQLHHVTPLYSLSNCSLCLFCVPHFFHILLLWFTQELKAYLTPEQCIQCIKRKELPNQHEPQLTISLVQAEQPFPASLTSICPKSGHEFEPYYSSSVWRFAEGKHEVLSCHELKQIFFDLEITQIRKKIAV